MSKSEMQPMSSARGEQQAQLLNPANINQSQMAKTTTNSKFNTPAKTDKKGDQLLKKTVEEEMAEVDQELK